MKTQGREERPLLCLASSGQVTTWRLCFEQKADPDKTDLKSKNMFSFVTTKFMIYNKTPTLLAKITAAIPATQDTEKRQRLGLVDRQFDSLLVFLLFE